jgi:DnaJ-class molecular chaperone
VIEGLGMMKNNLKGNLIIEFDVIFPDSLTPDLIEKLREVL